MNLYIANYKTHFTDDENIYSLVRAESTEEAHKKVRDKKPDAFDIEIEEPIE